MRNDFEKWMSNKYEITTIASYASAINRISQHYSGQTGQNIDIYRIRNIALINRICTEYNIGGVYQDFGNKGNGTNRAAISAYVRFIEETGFEENYELDEETKFKVSEGNILVKKNSTGKKTISISLVITEETE